MGQMSAFILASSNASTPQVDLVITTLDTINNTIQISLSEIQDNLNDALHQLDNVDTGAFVRQIDDLTQGILNFDPNSTLSQFNSIYDSINDLDFSSAINQINSLNGSFDQVNANLDKVRQFRNSTIRVKTFLQETLPGYLDQLTVNALQTIRDNSGVSAMILHVTHILDDIIAFVNHTASPYVDFGYNLTDKVAGKTDILDDLTSDYPEQYGSIQFFIHMADRASSEFGFGSGFDQFVQPGDPREANGRALTDGNGNDYHDSSGNKQYCVTRNCLYNTADYYTKTKVSSSITFVKVPVDLTPEQIAGLPYLIPFFVCVFATLAVVLGLCVKGSAGTSWASCCSSVTACFIFCQMPGIFLFAGFFFVVPIVMGDFCFGIENVGAQLLHRAGDGVCPILGSMVGQTVVGNADLCSFNVSTSGVDVQFSVNVNDAYAALLGSCDSFPVDPLRSLWTSAAQQVRTLPYDQAGPYINGSSLSSQFQLKPAAQSVITSILNNMGLNAEAFVNDVSVSLGCNNLHGVYASVKSAFCCDTVGAIYWTVASWYLIGWSFLLCGCGASLLGRKRFGPILWGPEIEKHDVLARSQPKNEFEDNEPMAVDDHSAPPLEGQGKTIEPVALAPLDSSAAEGQFVPAAEGDNTTAPHDDTSRG